MNNTIIKPEQPQKTIYQYTDAQEFYNDFIPQQQPKQNKKSLEKNEIQQIKELYIQLGFKSDPCSYGYTQNGNEDIDKILNILLKSQDFVNLENLSLIFGSFHQNEEIISCIYSNSIIKKLTSWDQCKKLKKLLISIPKIKKNNKEEYFTNFYDLCSAKNLEGLTSLQVNFQKKRSRIEYQQIFSKKIIDHFNSTQTQLEIAKQELQLQNDELKERIECLQKLNFYLYNIEELTLYYGHFNQFSNLSKQLDIICYCMPKLKSLTLIPQKKYQCDKIELKQFNEDLEKSRSIKKLESISLQLPKVSADQENVDCARILVEKGVNLISLNFKIESSTISSKNAIKVFDYLCSKPLKKLAIDFCYNQYLDGSELQKLGQILTNKTVDIKHLKNHLVGDKIQPNQQQDKQVYFHEIIEQLSINFSDHNDNQFINFFNNLTVSNKFKNLKQLEIFSYSSNLSGDKFREVVDLLTSSNCFQQLKLFKFGIAGRQITNKDQYYACKKIVNCPKFSNLEQLYIDYENSQMENDDYCVKVVEEIAKSKFMKNLKLLSQDFIKNSIDIKQCRKMIQILSKSNIDNQLELEEITICFWNNAIKKTDFIQLNRELRQQLLSDKLRKVNLSFGQA